jgi:hypothetical protein
MFAQGRSTDWLPAWRIRTCRNCRASCAKSCSPTPGARPSSRSGPPDARAVEPLFESALTTAEYASSRCLLDCRNRHARRRLYISARDAAYPSPSHSPSAAAAPSSSPRAATTPGCRADRSISAPAGGRSVRASRGGDPRNRNGPVRKPREASCRPCFDLRTNGGEGGIRTLERGYPRYAISSRARSTAPAPLQLATVAVGDRSRPRLRVGGATKATTRALPALLGSRQWFLRSAKRSAPTSA